MVIQMQHKDPHKEGSYDVLDIGGSIGSHVLRWAHLTKTWVLCPKGSLCDFKNWHLRMSKNVCNSENNMDV